MRVRILESAHNDMLDGYGSTKAKNPAWAHPSSDRCATHFVRGIRRYAGRARKVAPGGRS